MKKSLPLLVVLFVGIHAQSVFAQDNSCKCCTGQYDDFNFWIGEWTVYQPGGKLAGTNSIQPSQDSCVLIEQWTSASKKYSGMSMNYFDTKDSLWHQVWIDNAGATLHLHGGFEDGSMVMRSDTTWTADNQYTIDMIRWTPAEDGSVRQHWQQKTSGGNWKTLFDGKYVASKM